jgi:hypothetical protein
MHTVDQNLLRLLFSLLMTHIIGTRGLNKNLITVEYNTWYSLNTDVYTHCEGRRSGVVVDDTLLLRCYAV